jgi:archaellum component FlaF (FlaF/FlaG flagellin family)
MGLSVSAASAILFTTFVILFGIVFGSFDHFQDSLMNSQDQQTERYEQMMDTSITIVVVDDTNDTMTLVNDGQAVIDLTDVNLLVNGDLVDRSLLNISVQGHTESRIWVPGESLVVQFPMDIDGARIKVTVKEWASAYHV